MISNEYAAGVLDPTEPPLPEDRAAGANLAGQGAREAAGVVARDPHRWRDMAIDFDAWHGAQSPGGQEAIDNTLAVSPDRDLIKAVMTNQALLAHVAGVPEGVIVQNYDSLRDSWAKQSRWGDAVGDDKAFHKHVVAEAEAADDRDGLFQGVERNAREAALSIDADRSEKVAGELFNRLPKEVGFHPDDYPKYLQLWRETTENVKAKVAEVMPWVEMIGKEMQEEGGIRQFSGVAKSLVDANLPAEDRALVFELVRQKTQKGNVDHGPGLTGQKPDEPFLAEGIVTDVLRGTNSWLRNIAFAGAGYLERLDALGDDYTGIGKDSKAQDIERALVGIREGKAAPVDSANMFKKSLFGAAESLVPSLAIAAGGVGATLSFINYHQESLDHFRDMGIPEGTAALMAVPSGIAKTLIDKIQWKWISRAPGVAALEKALSGVANPTRYVTGQVVKGLATGAGETIMEVGQDHFVDMAVKQVANWLAGGGTLSEDWSNAWEEAKQQAPDILLTMIPLILGGLGFAGAQDIHGINALIKSPALLRAAAFDDGAVARIMASDNPRAVLRQEWGNRGNLPLPKGMPAETPDSALPAYARSGSPAEVVRGAVQTLRDQHARDVAAVTSSIRDTEGIQSVVKTDAGWRVSYDDGRVQDGLSEEAVHAAIQEQGMVLTAAGAKGWTDVAGQLVERGAAPSVELSGEVVAAKRTEKGTDVAAFKPGKAGVRPVELTDQALAQVTQEMKDAGLTSAIIQGSNFQIRDTLGKVISGIKANIGKDGILTLIHEGAENSFRLGKASDAETQAAAASLVPVFAHDAEISGVLAGIVNGDTKSAAAQETLMNIIVSNELGQRKDGRRFKQGAITQGFMDALRFQGGKEAQTGIKKYLAMGRAIKTYFKALFAGMKALANARKAGMDLKDFDAFADKLLGIDRVKEDAGAAAEQAAAMVDDWVDPDSVKESNVPEGDSFSLSPAPAGKISRSEGESMDDWVRRLQGEMGAQQVTARADGPYTLGGEVIGEAYTIMAPGHPKDKSSTIAPPGTDQAGLDALARKAVAEFDREGGSFSLSPGNALDLVASRIDATLSDKPEKRRAIAQKMKENLAALGKRWEGKEVGNRREALVRDLQTLDAITAAIPSDLRGSIGGWVALAKLPTDEARHKELVARVGRISKVLERHLKEEFTDAIEALVKKSMPAREPGEKPKGKLGAEGHALVDAVAANMEMAKAEAEARIDALVKDMEAETDPEKLADLGEDLNLVSRFGALGKADHSAKDLAASFEWLSANIGRARSIWRTQEEARLAEVKGVIAEGVASVGAADMVDTMNAREGSDPMTSTRAAVSSIPGAIRAIFGENSAVTKRWRRKLRVAINGFLDDTAALQKDFYSMVRGVFGPGAPGWRKFYDMFQEEHPSGVKVVSGGAMATVKLPAEMARKILDGTAPELAKTYDKTALEAMRAALDANDARGKATGDKTKPLKDISFERESGGVEKELNLTQAEAIRLSLMWGQEQGRGPMEAHGFTEESIEALKKFMTTEAGAFREWFSTHYTAEWGPLNKVFSRMQGVALPQIANYAPLTFKAQGKIDTGGIDPFSGPMMDAGGMGMGMFKTRREKHNAQPAGADEFSTFFRHMKQTAYFRYFGEVVREMRNVLGNVGVQNAIAARHGENGTLLSKKMLEILDKGGSIAKSSIEDGRYNAMARARAIASLSWNPGTALKQTPAILNLAYRMPTGAFSAGMVKLVAGKLDMLKMLKTPTIRRRLEAGAGPEMQLALQGLEGERPNFFTETAHLGLMPLQKSDAFWTAGSAAIGYDYYKGVIRKESPGMNEEDVEAEAIARVEETLGDVAQPLSFLDKSIAELERGALARLVLLFQSESRQKIALQIEAGGEKQWGTMTKAIVLNGLIGITMQGVAAMMRDWQDDDDTKLFDPDHWKLRDFVIAGILGQWGALPVFWGIAIEGAAQMVKGVNFDNSLASDMSKAGHAVKSAYTAATAEDKTGELKEAEPFEKIVHGAIGLTNAAAVLMTHGEYGAAARIGGYFFDAADAAYTDTEERAHKVEVLQRKLSREDDPAKYRDLLKQLEALH